MDMSIIENVFAELNENKIFVNLDDSYCYTDNKKPKYDKESYLGILESTIVNRDEIIESLKEEGSVTVLYRFIPTAKYVYKKTIVAILESVFLKYKYDVYITVAKKNIEIELVVSKSDLSEEFINEIINEIIDEEYMSYDVCIDNEDVKDYVNEDVKEDVKDDVNDDLYIPSCLECNNTRYDCQCVPLERDEVVDEDEVVVNEVVDEVVNEEKKEDTIVIEFLEKEVENVVEDIKEIKEPIQKKKKGGRKKKVVE